MEATTKPVRFRFALVTLFVFLTIIACWVGYSANWMRQRRAFIRDHQSNVADATDVVAPGGLWLFGEKGTNMIHLQQASQGEVDSLQKLFPEAHVTNLLNPAPPR